MCVEVALPFQVPISGITAPKKGKTFWIHGSNGDERGLKTSMPPTPLTFAAFGSKPKVVDLAALTVLTGDARLALTLATVDVTLSVGGTQSVAVTPNK